MERNSELIQSVTNYYNKKISKHGAVPQGVDWNGVESQLTRFCQLSKIFPQCDLQGATILDFGCGYAGYLDYLNKNFQNFEYHGLDVSSAMINEAIDLYTNQDNCRFEVGANANRPVEYVISSGVFNVKLSTDDASWQNYVEKTLDMFNQYSTKGFAFNCLTSYSDKDKMKDHLHYTNPEMVFSHCKTQYSRDVALLHDYGLYEFTVLVKK